eukprot:1391840-Amphidinium_carterae.1
MLLLVAWTKNWTAHWNMCGTATVFFKKKSEDAVCSAISGTEAGIGQTDSTRLCQRKVFQCNLSGVLPL